MAFADRNSINAARVLFPTAAGGRGSGWLVGTGSSPSPAPCKAAWGWGRGTPSSGTAPLAPSTRSPLGLACRPQDPASWGRTQTALGSAGDENWAGSSTGLTIPNHPFPKVQPCLEGEDGSQNPRVSDPLRSLGPVHRHLGWESKAGKEDVTSQSHTNTAARPGPSPRLLHPLPHSPSSPRFVAMCSRDAGTGSSVPPKSLS